MSKFITRRLKGWISIGINVSITKEPVVFGLRALVFNNRLSLTAKRFDYVE